MKRDSTNNLRAVLKYCFRNERLLSKTSQMLCAPAANVHFPEGFSMGAGVQYFLPARRAARVDKPRKVEAAVAGIILWGKSADG